MPDWTWILTDNSYTPLGELLNISQRKLALPLNKVPTASFQMRLDNPMSEFVEGAAGYVKIYRDDTLMFYGPIISVDEVASDTEQTIAVNVAGAAWILQKRLQKEVLSWGAGNEPDRAALIGSMIAISNVQDGNTGIWVPNVVGTDMITSPDMSFGTFTGPGYTREPVTYTNPTSAGGKIPDDTTLGSFKPIMEFVRELSVGMEGFDWTVVPYDNHQEGAVQPDRIGEFRAWPLFGEDQAEAVFEYGTGRHNIQEYKRTVSRDGQANTVYHLSAEGPNSVAYPVVSAIDSESISSWKTLEDLAQADLLALDFRERLVQEHVRIRAQPRKVIEFTPHIFIPGRMPNFGEDYRVGDNVRVRIVYNERTRVDALVRVWGVTFDVDDTGTERVSMLLAEEA